MLRKTRVFPMKTRVALVKYFIMLFLIPKMKITTPDYIKYSTNIDTLYLIHYLLCRF